MFKTVRSERGARFKDHRNSALPFTRLPELVRRSARVNVDVAEAVGDVKAIDDADQDEVLPHVTPIASFAAVVVGHVLLDLTGSSVQSG